MLRLNVDGVVEGERELSRTSDVEIGFEVRAEGVWGLDVVGYGVMWRRVGEVGC